MFLCEHVGSLRRTLHRALTRRLAGESVRPFTQLLALKVIGAGEVRTQVELADRLLVDAPTVSRLVTTLEKEGLLERGEGENRRCVHLHVTPKAQPEIDILEHGLSWLDREIRGHLSETEFKTLLKLMAKVQRGLDASPPNPERTATPRKAGDRKASTRIR